MRDCKLTMHIVFTVRSGSCFIVDYTVRWRDSVNTDQILSRLWRTISLKTFFFFFNARRFGSPWCQHPSFLLHRLDRRKQLLRYGNLNPCYVFLASKPISQLAQYRFWFVYFLPGAVELFGSFFFHFAFLCVSRITVIIVGTAQRGSRWCVE